MSLLVQLASRRILIESKKFRLSSLPFNLPITENLFPFQTCYPESCSNYQVYSTVQKVIRSRSWEMSSVIESEWSNKSKKIRDTSPQYKSRREIEFIDDFDYSIKLIFIRNSSRYFKNNRVYYELSHHWRHFQQFKLNFHGTQRTSNKFDFPLKGKLK